MVGFQCDSAVTCTLSYGDHIRSVRKTLSIHKLPGEATLCNSVPKLHEDLCVASQRPTTPKHVVTAAKFCFQLGMMPGPIGLLHLTLGADPGETLSWKSSFEHGAHSTAFSVLLSQMNLHLHKMRLPRMWSWLRAPFVLSARSTRIIVLEPISLTVTADFILV